MSAINAGEPMLDKLKHRVEAFGWECLSDVWCGGHARYRFVCARGHLFERIAGPLLYRNRGAAECTLCEQEDLRVRFQQTVSEHGGRLVGEPFTNLQGIYRLRCAGGHEWEARGSKIMEGHWCPACARQATARRNRKADGLAQLQAAAVARGGRCLSTEYTVGRRRYAFECTQGHRWKAEGHEVLRRSWCPLCARGERNAAQLDPQGLAHLQSVAVAKGGQCLTPEYLGQAARYRFRCAAGHEWQTSGQNVLNGRWCRRCASEGRRLKIGEMHALAAQRGGACLSQAYVNKDTPLTWECHRGHVWQAPAASIKHGGHWCGACAILDRIHAKNGWKRQRYEGTGKLPI